MEILCTGVSDLSFLLFYLRITNFDSINSPSGKDNLSRQLLILVQY